MWKLMVMLFFSLFLITCKKEDEEKMVRKWAPVNSSGDTYLIIKENGTFSRKDLVRSTIKYTNYPYEIYGTWVKNGDNITFTINNKVYIHTMTSGGLDTSYQKPCTDIYTLESVSRKELVLIRTDSIQGCFCDSEGTKFIYEKYKEKKD